MKDNKIIEKLSLLKSVQPDAETLRLIRKRIPLQKPSDKKFSFYKRLTISPLVPLVAIACILILLIAIANFIPQNHYEKAKIAVANANVQFAAYKKSPTNDQQINSLSHSLALANIQMTNLKLVGEKGKYTMKDCLSLYSTYHASLETMKKSVSSQNSSKEVKLLSEIKQYEEQSEKKMHKYSE
jgi:hypothetical protein